MLGSTEDAAVNFTAGFAESGIAEVEARSTVVLTCGTSQVTTYGSATSAITVVAPLRIENVSASPDAVTPGTLSNLSAVVVGGQPPYRLRVEWNVGNVSFYNVSAPGRFSFEHRYPSGSFSPTILASDAAGLFANGSVDGTLSVGTNLTVAVTTSSVATEVGVPVQFSGEILDPPAQYGWETLCTDAQSVRQTGNLAIVSAKNFTCTFAATGSAEVDFEVIPINDDLPIAEARWSEPVAPRLALNVSSPGGMAEVGLPTVFTASLSGGVPPFLLTWRLAGNSTVRQDLTFADGPVLLPVWPSESGTYSLSVTVQDAVGVLVAVGTAALPVDPPLSVSASADGILSSSGALVRATGAVSQGTAPFRWWVLPGLWPTAESAPNGTLTSIASFSWNGTLEGEGNSTVSIVVVDGEGAAWRESIAVPLVPELRANAQAIASSTATSRAFLLNLSVGGGLSPFELWVNSSAAEEWNRSIPSDDAYSFTLPTNDSGSVRLEVSVRDRLGADWTNDLVVVFQSTPSPPNSTSPPPSPVQSPTNNTSDGPPSTDLSSTLSLVVVAGAGIAAFALFWRRSHRAAPDPAPAPDPARVIRRILEPAEGADRSTVELMAEEAGIPLETVRTTIDRLVSEGSIRSESGPDGEEVLAWWEPDPA